MMLAITTIFDIIKVCPSFFTQQTFCLGTCHMKMIFATRFIAIHACTNLSFCLFALTLTNVTRLCKIKVFKYEITKIINKLSLKSIPCWTYLLVSKSELWVPYWLHFQNELLGCKEHKQHVPSLLYLFSWMHLLCMGTIHISVQVEKKRRFASFIKW